VGDYPLITYLLLFHSDRPNFDIKELLTNTSIDAGVHKTNSKQKILDDRPL